jgi:CDP-L-myo-inositol myo-inositolphosphotransferase
LSIPLIDPHPRSKPGDGFVSRHFNRWVSSPISELLLRTRVSPNQVSLIIASLAIPMIVVGAYGRLLMVAVLWQLISALDGINGEIARAKGLSTRFGALLDTTLDYTIDSIGALSIGIAILVRPNVPSPVILSIVVVAITARHIRTSW